MMDEPSILNERDGMCGLRSKGTCAHVALRLKDKFEVFSVCAVSFGRCEIAIKSNGVQQNNWFANVGVRFHRSKKSYLTHNCPTCRK